MNQRKRVKKVKVRKIKFGRILLLLIIISLIIFLVMQFIDKKIKNIYVINSNSNYLLKDQYILDISELSDYPSSLKNSSSKIKNKLDNNIFIKEAVVYKKGLYSVYIEIKENRTLFYNSSNSKYILEDGKEVSYDDFSSMYPKLITHLPIVPTLVNYTPEDIYNKLIMKMCDIDDSVLSHISEIRYDPNNVDEERFLFTMSDGNYVYITPSRMNLINKYLDIVIEVDGKKGTLYLDYGDHFVFE